jgi:hypothetical protein
MIALLQLAGEAAAACVPHLTLVAEEDRCNPNFDGIDDGEFAFVLVKSSNSHFAQ